jgi:hypothetical protein
MGSNDHLSRTAPADSDRSRYMDTLSRVLVRAYCDHEHGALKENREPMGGDWRYVAGLNRSQWQEFLALAHSHHVVMRALAVLQDAASAEGDNSVTAGCEIALAAERARIGHAAGFLQQICQALGSRGCEVAVIKSLDHWPDLGSDLDLYTTAGHQRAEEVMRAEFNAHPVAHSWGDRLANKWNFKVPGLPELVEIHVQFLGQTGEQDRMARRIIERRTTKSAAGHQFSVPAPEERILISTLQRMYRHFYFRLCDMIDVALLLRTETVDFDELRRAADLAGIWPGVATFLCLIRSYVQAYEGSMTLPQEVLASQGAVTGVRFKDGFLRVSKLAAAGLYGSQLLHAGRHRDLRSLVRLPLLPPLAVSALVAYRLTGSDKGIW